MNITAWFAGRLPDWFTGDPEVRVDREEIIVLGTLKDEGENAHDASYAKGRIERFREETRAERMRIADSAEAAFGRKVAWGARLGEVEEIFTNVSVPVMTRLRQPERMVLDTLVAAGVARSRSDALAWCVRLVGANEEAWLSRLTDALADVDTARRSGPDSKASGADQDQPAG